MPPALLKQLCPQDKNRATGFLSLNASSIRSIYLGLDAFEVFWCGTIALLMWHDLILWRLDLSVPGIYSAYILMCIYSDVFAHCVLYFSTYCSINSKRMHQLGAHRAGLGRVFHTADNTCSVLHWKSLNLKKFVFEGPWGSMRDPIFHLNGWTTDHNLC